MNNNAKLITSPVAGTLARMTAPMILGLFAVIAFNLADTYFVSKLGTTQLAAMSFTFPVVFLIGNLTVGLGMGTSSVVSQAIGRGDFKRAKELTTNSLALSLLIVVAISTVGLLTIRPLFTALGATPDILPLIERYMTVWYFGMVCLVIPMVGNSAIRATGDARAPGIIMTTGAVINVILDPIMIFGLWGFPRLELAGAAIATVIARAFTMVVAILILHFREKILDFSIPKLEHAWQSWKRILHIAVPCAATNTITPISLAVLTMLASGFGPEAVAAIGAGIRVESFALIILMALGSVLMPFIGQNWGAGRLDRVRLGQQYSSLFCLFWGLLCVIVFIFAAESIGRIFSKDPLVIENIALYLFIVPIGYGLRGVYGHISAVFNGTNSPIRSLVLNLLWLLVLFLPFTWLGAKLYGFNGMLSGLVLANIIAGIIALVWVRRYLNFGK